MPNCWRYEICSLGVESEGHGSHGKKESWTVRSGCVFFGYLRSDF